MDSAKSSGLAVGGLGSSLGSPMTLLCDIGPVASPLKRSDGACRMLFQPGWTGLRGGKGLASSSSVSCPTGKVSWERANAWWPMALQSVFLHGRELKYRRSKKSSEMFVGI